MYMKLLDILIESMADGNAFKAFVDSAVAKKETETNEGLNLEKRYRIYDPSIGYTGVNVNRPMLDELVKDDVVFVGRDGKWYTDKNSAKLKEIIKQIKHKQ